MAKLICACWMAFLLAACGGGGGPGEFGSASQQSAQALKAKPVPGDAGFIAQPVSIVNTATAGDQIFVAIGAQANGGYTVAWLSQNTTLFIQHYGSSGNKVGSEIAVPLFVACEPSCGGTAASVIGAGGLTVLNDGSVVVAYSVTRAAGAPSLESKRAVYIQRFDATGAQVLPETEAVSSIEVLHSRSPVFALVNVAPLADDGFVVGWANMSTSSIGVTSGTISTRRYDNQAQPVGDPVLVASFSAFAAPALRLAADAHGGYTVSWVQPSMEAPFAPLTTVVHFDANGTATPIVANSAATVLLLPLASNGFVLFTSSPAGSFRQFLDSAGNPVGDPLAISAMPFDARELADGTFAVFWVAAGNIRLQRFDSTGAAIGNIATLESNGVVAGIAPLAGGGFAAAWSALGTGGDRDVFTQRFGEAIENEHAALRAKRKACLESAGGMRGQERKAFMDACLA